MGAVIGIVLVFLGWVGLVSATFMWGGYGIFQLVKTDLSFFSVVLPCLGYWCLQMVCSLVALVIGGVLVND